MPYALRTALVLSLVTGCYSPQPQKDVPKPEVKVSESVQGGPDAKALQAKAAGLFKALPAEMSSESNPVTPEKVALGRMLFYENRLSKNQDLSCNSCHGLDTFGVDNKPTSPGHKGQLGNRNSPTVYNAALHVAQFWDGRAADVEAQAQGPVLNPVEMAMPDADYVLRVLGSIPGYTEAFKAAFPADADPITYDNYARAVGAFERGLVTPSPFDAFVGGDTSALNAAQLQGLQTFIEVGCITCHIGPGIGGGMFQKLGLVKPYETADLGRYEVTKNEADRYFFKVPSLRNIEKTAPYFHDGSIATLDAAVGLMGEHQLGKTLTPEQTSQIVAFLSSLTGTLPAEYIAKPTLPESGPKTPKPDPT